MQRFWERGSRDRVSRAPGRLITVKSGAQESLHISLDNQFLFLEQLVLEPLTKL